MNDISTSNQKILKALAVLEDISGQTAKALQGIVDSVKNVTKLTEDIANASKIHLREKMTPS